MLNPNTTVLIFYLLLLLSCKQKPNDHDPAALPKSRGLDAPREILSKDSSLCWSDSAIAVYIRQCDNQLVKAFRNDSTPIEWMLDSVENTDTAKWLIFQVSHSEEYKESTLAWLYIDSVKRTIYEYDVATDSLIKWREYPYH